MGQVASRKCAIPASINEGCAWMVVERAYTVSPSVVGTALRRRHRAHRIPSSCRSALAILSPGQHEGSTGRIAWFILGYNGVRFGSAAIVDAAEVSAQIQRQKAILAQSPISLLEHAPRKLSFDESSPQEIASYSLDLANSLIA
jgi:hypothetical protein